MMIALSNSLLHLASFLVLACTIVQTCSQEILTADILYEGVIEGLYDAIIDVRTQDEWDEVGHIPNATHIENIQSMSMPPFPDLLDGGCNSGKKIIVIYCRSGARASVAIQNLLDNGYEATLYNGQGINQWQEAGFDLIFTESQEPMCYSDSSVTFEQILVPSSIFSSIMQVFKLLLSPFLSLFDNLLGLVFRLSI